MNVCFAATTAAASHLFIILEGKSQTFTAEGFTGTDAITLQTYGPSSTYVDCVEDSTTIRLSATNNVCRVNGPFKGKWNKGVTDGSVSLAVERLDPSLLGFA